MERQIQAALTLSGNIGTLRPDSAANTLAFRTDYLILLSTHLKLGDTTMIHIFSSRVLLTALLLLSGIACQAETSNIETITPAELSQRLKEPNPPIILDVRTRDEYSSGHIDTALNLPHDELERRLDEIPGNKTSEIVVYCRSGKRARIAENILIEKGYQNVKDLARHWQGWSSQAK